MLYSGANRMVYRSISNMLNAPLQDYYDPAYRYSCYICLEIPSISLILLHTMSFYTGIPQMIYII